MNNILLKSIVLISFLLFVDYLLMIIIGCTTCLIGFGDHFYENTFQGIGKIIVLLSIIGFVITIFQDLRTFRKKSKAS